MSISAPLLSFYLIAKMLKNQNKSAKVDSRYHNKLMEMDLYLVARYVVVT